METQIKEGDYKKKRNIETNISKISDNSKKKLEFQPVSEKVRRMSNRDKINYYRSKGLDSLADNREAIRRHHEGKGITHQPAKVNSSNFKKISEIRNLDKKDAQNLKESFSKWSPDNKNRTNNDDVTARHARKGEKAVVTHTKGEKPSGVFVSKKSLGNTPEKRIDIGALSSGNKANKETKVIFDRNQDVIEGPIGPQPKFERIANDGIPRRGGGIQTITDGGYKKAAIKNVDK